MPLMTKHPEPFKNCVMAVTMGILFLWGLFAVIEWTLRGTKPEASTEEPYIPAASNRKK